MKFPRFLTQGCLVILVATLATSAFAQTGSYPRKKRPTTRVKTISIKQASFLNDSGDFVEVRSTLTYGKYQVQVTPRLNPSIKDPNQVVLAAGCAEVRMKAFNLTLKSPILKIKGGDSQNCRNAPESYVFNFTPAIKKPNRLKTVDDARVFGALTDSDCKAFYRGEIPNKDANQVCPTGAMDPQEGLAIDIETLVEVPTDYANAVESANESQPLSDDSNELQ